MGYYVTPLIVEKLDYDSENWRLVGPLKFWSDVLKELVDAQVGFVTDFASVPRLPVLYAVFGNIAHRPATLHDWGYRNGLWTRKDCDLLFQEALACEPWIEEWKQRQLYEAVVLFGESSYKGAVDGYDRVDAKKCYGLWPKEGM